MNKEMDELDIQRSRKEDSKEKEKGRDQWGGQFEFLLACLGNCWRFPYLCFKNGGGAFLFPYIVCCFVIGFPLFLIELSLGQFSAMGPAHLWANLSPIFKGVGIASVISSAIVAIYYNMIIAWTLFYFVESLLGQKWKNCDHWFNSPNCTTIQSGNFTNSSISSTEEFFDNYVLAKSSGIHEMTSLNWKLVAALFASWAIVVLALIKGIKSSGKVVYFTAIFPYFCLTFLFARGVTLDGAGEGLRFFFTPNWSRVSDVNVWRDAAVQVFYSFGIGGGGMITYASYNSFHNPVVKHALIVGIGDFLTSVFCGATVFTMIGYMAHALDKPIDSIVQSGTGLAFIAIPEGLAKLPISISISSSMLFFAMLFLLGIDSQFAMIETVITYIFDTMRDKKGTINKPLVVTSVGICWFICGIPLCSNAGVYILTLMDTYSAAIPCLIIGALEIFIIVFIYGLDKFFDNLRNMTGWNPRTLIRSHIVVMISLVAPTVILLILYSEVLSLISDNSPPLSYGNYKFPDWANKLGIGIAVLSISSIPLYMFTQTANILCCSSPRNVGATVIAQKTFYCRLQALVQPTDLWFKNELENASKENMDSLKVQSIECCQTDSGIDLKLPAASMSTFTHSSNDSLATTATPSNGHINRAMDDETEF